MIPAFAGQGGKTSAYRANSPFPFRRGQHAEAYLKAGRPQVTSTWITARLSWRTSERGTRDAQIGIRSRAWIDERFSLLPEPRLRSLRPRGAPQSRSVANSFFSTASPRTRAGPIEA